MTSGGPETGWRRLHPLTILKELGALAWALVAALLLDFGQPPMLEDIAGPEAVISVGVFGYAVARYLFTAYRITDQSLEMRRGVFVKSFQSMPRDRVQAVSTNTSFVGRLLGITTVEVSAADAEDIRLGFVSEEAADGLRRVLEKALTATEEEGEADRHAVASLDFGRLLTFGLTETGLVPAVLLLVGTVVVAFTFGWFFAPLTFGFVVIWPLIRTLGLVGFRSWIEESRVRVEAGILGRRRNESPLGRIQAIQVNRPPLRRLLGLETISIVTGDVGVSSDTVLLAGAVAPLERIGTWRSISEALIGRVALGEATLEPSSRHTIRRMMVRGALVLALVVAAVGAATLWLGVAWWIAGVVAALGLIGLIAYSAARWKVLGWAADEHHLLVRRGVVLRRLTVVPIHKVQDITVRSTFFQRRLGIATVEVDTAGLMLAGRVVAIDLDEDRARALADHLADVAAQTALPDGV